MDRFHVVSMRYGILGSFDGSLLIGEEAVRKQLKNEYVLPPEIEAKAIQNIINVFFKPACWPKEHAEAIAQKYRGFLMPASTPLNPVQSPDCAINQQDNRK